MSGRRRMMMRGKGGEHQIIPLEWVSKGINTGYRWDGTGLYMSSWSIGNKTIWECKKGDIIHVECVCITDMSVFSEITADGYIPLVRGLDQWNAKPNAYEYEVPHDMNVCLSAYMYANNNKPTNLYLTRK